MWCPKCKTEYLKEVETCPECGSALVEDLEEEFEDEESAVDILYTPAKTYVKKRDAYKDLLYSGLTFIIFGVLGEVYLVLCELNKLPVTYNMLIATIIGAMFAGFIIFGIMSMVKAKAEKRLIAEEEKNTEEIMAWLEENVTKERVLGWIDASNNIAENDMLVTAHIRAALLSEFPECEVSYLELLTEEYFNTHFLEENYMGDKEDESEE